MILREDIIKLSKIHGIKPWQEEKRYIQTLILNSLYDEKLVFKGGTYLWLFHGLRRFSEDLDFTLLNNVNKDLPYKISENLELSGMKNDVKILKDNNVTFSFRILSEGPLNSGVIDRNPVYIEISKREKVINKTLQVRFDFPEYNLPVRIIYGMELDEVSSEKVRAVYTRKKARDIYDLYYLITRKKVNFDLNLINKKLEYYGIKFDLNTFLQNLREQEKYFKKELENIVMDNIPDINEIINIIISWAK